MTSQTTPMKSEQILLKHINHPNCKDFIHKLKERELQILMNILVPGDKNTAQAKQSIQDFEKGFIEQQKKGTKRETEKATQLLKQFYQEVNKTSKLRSKSNTPEKKLYTQQTLNRLEYSSHPVTKQLIDLIEAKTGFNATDPMSSIQKMLGGSKDKDPTKATKDSELDIGASQAAGFMKAEMIGRICGFSALSSAAAGVVLPLLPLLLARKAIPDLIPVFGGLKTDGALSEKTSWNSVDKNTKIKIGDEKIQSNNHTSYISQDDTNRKKGGITR